jgi:hypothetical protein
LPREGDRRRMDESASVFLELTTRQSQKSFTNWPMN